MNNAIPETYLLSAVEQEILALFVRVADVLSLPRSVGEIYGLLFVSSEPLCLDDCRMRLNISKGSTSQGLKILRSFGAIRTVYIPGDRKDYYAAETSLRKMVSGFASEQVLPHVHSGKDRVAQLRSMLEETPSGEEHDFLWERIEILGNWQKRAEKSLPLVLKLIGG